MVKRKIPARKHHGVRDPLQQQVKQLEKIKNKINNPPPKNDQDKISYNLSQLIKGKNEAKRGQKVKKKITIGIEDKPNHVKNKIKPIKPFPNEDDENYLKRVNRATTDSLMETQYEIKYGVEVHRNPKTGEISVKKKPQDEITKLMKNKKMKKNITKTVNLNPKLSKDLIKQVLKEERLEKKKDIKEFRKDNVKFGEIVHAPPTFSVLPKKAEKSETVPRPGKKDLLLKTIIRENSIPEKKIKSKSHTNFKGKRKDLAPGARNMIEEERIKIVEIYRNLKKNKDKI